MPVVIRILSDTPVRTILLGTLVALAGWMVRYLHRGDTRLSAIPEIAAAVAKLVEREDAQDRFIAAARAECVADRQALHRDIERLYQHTLAERED